LTEIVDGFAGSFFRVAFEKREEIIRGFVGAIAIGIVVGLLMCDSVTNQMQVRGSPNFRDLIIALASGVAAACAMGRPNLLSALPGVAIAAALVPPVATAGIAASVMDWKLASGAILLFLTNIVAIVLGTTVTFWAIGLTRSKPDKDNQNSAAWPRWSLLALVISTIALTALMQVMESVTGHVSLSIP
jgi:uncharacterized membrane protein